MKYNVDDVKVIKDGAYYNVYVNDRYFDFFSKVHKLSLSSSLLLSKAIGVNVNWTSNQLQQYLIRNHLHESPQPPTKLTVAEIEQKLGVTNLEIVGDD